MRLATSKKRCVERPVMHESSANCMYNRSTVSSWHMQLLYTRLHAVAAQLLEKCMCLLPISPVASLQEDRQWALRRGLEEINKEIEAASRTGIASCWFPMGTRNERIIRLAAKEASLLNSRYSCSSICTYAMYRLTTACNDMPPYVSACLSNA